MSGAGPWVSRVIKLAAQEDLFGWSFGRNKGGVQLSKRIPFYVAERGTHFSGFSRARAMKMAPQQQTARPCYDDHIDSFRSSWAWVRMRNCQ
jgi:hypothetical protein